MHLAASMALRTTGPGNRRQRVVGVPTRDWRKTHYAMKEGSVERGSSSLSCIHPCPIPFYARHTIMSEEAHSGPGEYNHTALKERRQSLRSDMPKSETLLWEKLRGQQINGLRFRRQYSVGPFLLDFYCPAARVGIEVDGDSHVVEGAALADRSRQECIEGHHITVLRVSNSDVSESMDGVLRLIAKCCNRPLDE